MISEDDLRRLLARAAASAEPPEDGAERILLARADAQPARPARRKPFRERRADRPAGRRTARRESRWALAALVLVAVVIGGGVGVGQLSDRQGSSSTSTTGAPAPAARDGASPDSGAAGQGAPGSAAAPSTVPVPGRPDDLPSTGAKIVQKGQITLQVDADRVPDAVDRLGAIATGLRGYVAASSTTDSRSASGTVTLRVPASAYPQVLTQTRGLGRVTRSSSDSEDVTGEVVDLEARIQTLKDTRASYQALLGRAGTVDEILQVQQRITEVQTEIEQLQGRQQVLTDQAALATVTITVTTPSRTSSLSSQDDGLGGAWRRAVSGFGNGVEWLVAASGPVFFVALLALLLAWPVRWGVRRLRRQMI